MTINIETAIAHGKALVGKIRYSMYGSRTGTDGSADCSGFVYACLRAGGASNYGWVPSTEYEHDFLLKNGYTLIAENSSWSGKRGDVVIWGKKGYSAGANGHTGIMLDSTNWIECTAYRSLGVTIQNYASRFAMNGNPHFYVYRLKANSTGNGGSNTVKPTPTPTPSPAEPKRTAKSGTFKVGATTNVRDYPSTKTGNVVATYKKGESFKYDSYCDADGYRWYSYIGGSGYRRYVADVGGGSNSGTSTAKPSTPSASKPSAPKLKGSDLPQKGTYKFTVNTNVRASASTNSAIVAMYKAGESLKYDSKVTAGGYVWLSYVGGSGKRRYVAVV